jgi:hypothetical protein
MNQIYTALSELVSRRDAWSRADVGVACYLFSFMAEVAWTLLVHAAQDRSPVAYNKQHTTPCIFKIELRKSSVVPFKLPKPIKEPSAMPAPARVALVRLMTEWSPYYHDDGVQVVYNPMSYWLMALRAARDIGTHRTLSHVQVAPAAGYITGSTPAVGTSVAAYANAGTAFAIKLPVNPALEYSDYDSHMQFAVVTDVLACFPPTNNRGYCMVPIGRMAADMLVVATALHDGLAAVIEQCRPAT